MIEPARMSPPGTSATPWRRVASQLSLAVATALCPAWAGQEGVPFVDATEASGLDFVHFNGMTGELYFPEMTGQGGALFDYDGDGDLDVYLVQGALLGDDTMESALFPPGGELPPSDRLLRNDLSIAAAGGSSVYFTDVTAAAGIEATGYGMGVATGDFDDDGWVDLYVTNYGPNQLLRNNGDGTFSDVTASSGTGDPLWGTSAAFADLDGDGLLDLYVANYVDFDVGRNPSCFATSSRRDYCGPSGFPPQPDRLFLNLGNGRFRDATTALLRGYRAGPGLGVTSADFNGDGRADLYVANDGAANQLWLGRPDGTLADEALLAGVAVNRMGLPEASMGVDAGDVDNDGDDDLFMTHLMGETNTLYINDGEALFEDRTVAAGLAAGSLPFTSFGTAFFDYDNDGWLDLLTANGAVRILEEQAASGDPFPLRQPNQLFHNQQGRFQDVSAEVPVLGIEEVSRGAALGDIDNDGDVDVLVLNNNGPARLLENRLGSDSMWLGVAPRRRSVAPLLGVRVVSVGDTPAAARRARSDGSYCSANDPRVIIGGGAAGTQPPVRVVLPGGRTLVWRQPPARHYVTVMGEQGEG